MPFVCVHNNRYGKHRIFQGCNSGYFSQILYQMSLRVSSYFQMKRKELLTGHLTLTMIITWCLLCRRLLINCLFYIKQRNKSNMSYVLIRHLSLTILVTCRPLSRCLLTIYLFNIVQELHLFQGTSVQLFSLFVVCCVAVC